MKLLPYGILTCSQNCTIIYIPHILTELIILLLSKRGTIVSLCPSKHISTRQVCVFGFSMNTKADGRAHCIQINYVAYLEN